MPTSGDPKSGDCLFFTTPPSPPRWKIDPAPNRNDLGHYMTTYMMYILSKFDARNNLCQWLNTSKNAPETVLRIRKIQVFSKKSAKSQTKSVLFFTNYSIFILDVKSGRVMTAGERETRQKRVSLPPKAGELASLPFISEIIIYICIAKAAPVSSSSVIRCWVLRQLVFKLTNFFHYSADQPT